MKNLSSIERIHPKRRTAIASYVIGIWFMQDLSPAASEISFASKPDTHARIFMRLLADEEYERAREELGSVDTDSTLHIALHQMLLVTPVKEDVDKNRRAFPQPNFLVATHWNEQPELRQKIDAELSITELIENGIGTQGREHYKDIGLRTLEAHGHSTDLRQLTARTIHDSRYWLDH